MQQRNELRERKRIECIAKAQEKQQSQAIQQQSSVPHILRQRSACWRHIQTRYSCLDECKLAFAGMVNRRTFTLSANTAPISSMRMLASGSPGNRLFVAGYRNGRVHQNAIDAHGGVLRRHSVQGVGEVVGIEQITSDRFAYATMGSGDTPGALSVHGIESTAAHRLEFSGDSLYCISGPVHGDSTKIAIGMTKSVVVAALTDTSIQAFSKIRTGTDIMSAAFINSPYVFAGGGRDGRVRLFDMRLEGSSHNRKNGLFSSSRCRHDSCVYAMGYCNGLLVSAGMDSVIQAWDIRMPSGWESNIFYTQQRQSSIPGNRLPSAYLASSLLSQKQAAPATCRLGFAARESVVAAASASDSHIRLWSMPTGRLLRAIPLSVEDGPCTALDLACSSANRPALYAAQSNKITAYAHPATSVYIAGEDMAV
ncbi:hypothetical protein GGI12_003857 [Dipsacomyces acuminosporus]|nr:hypothetical protein GGI12_003857 [Dipsacomyces acuminosporus]